MIREDFASPTWRRFTQDLERRLEELRRMNDAPVLTAEQTALIRGQIKEVKRILSLDKSESPEVGRE